MKFVSVPMLAAALAAGGAVAVPHVDVLVAYDTSSQAYLAAEGLDAQTFAEGQIAKANAVLANSGLSDAFDFRLAGAFLGAFTHDRLMSLADTLYLAPLSEAAEWSELRAARERSGADIVAIFADTGVSDGEMGLAFGLQPLVQIGGEGEFVRQWGLEFEVADQYLKWFAQRAYCIVDVVAADAGYMFMHEIGHLMGAGHADLISRAYAEPGPQLYPYSSGLMMRGSDGEYYSTIMGYNLTGNADSAFYEIVPYFSSPGLTYPATGDPLGDADHDNVTTLRNTCVAVSNFRKSVLPDTVVPGGTDTGSGSGAGAGVAASSFSAKKTIFTAAVTDEGEVVGIAQFTVNGTRRGISRVTGQVYGLDGKKKTFKAVKCEPFDIGDGVARVALKNVEIAKYTGGTLSVTLGSDGSVAGGKLGVYDIAKADLGGLPQNAGFYLEEVASVINGEPVLEEISFADGTDYVLIPMVDAPQQVVTSGKWNVPAKPGSLRAKKNRDGTVELLPKLGKGGANFSALKLKYQPKTGVFTGSFTLYTFANDKLKKHRFGITGLSVGGEAVGIGVCKKPSMTLPVRVR